MARKLLKTGKTLGALAGIGLLAAVVAWSGPRVIWQQVLELRWVLPVIVAFGLLKHVFRALAWSMALRAEGVELRFLDVLKARITSQSFAYLSGMGLLVSEPVRPLLLRRQASVGSTLAASLLESVVYWLTSIVVTSVGFMVAAQVLAEQANTGLLLGAWLAVFVLLMLLLFSTRPLLPLLGRAARLWPRLSRRVQPLLHRATDTEARVRSFRLRHPGITLAVLATDVLVQVVMFAEVWVVLLTLGIGISPLQVFAIEAGSRTVKLLTFYLPGRVGADEAGAAGSFMLLGLDPAAGVSLAISRRVQGLFWAAVGFVALAGSPKTSDSFESRSGAVLDGLSTSNVPTVKIAKETS